MQLLHTPLMEDEVSTQWGGENNWMETLSSLLKLCYALTCVNVRKGE